MPTFGDFETIDEPIESREDGRHFTRVWQARRISAQDGRLYAVKCYIPRHARRAAEAAKELLEEHRSLEYIEGVKQIKKAAVEGKQGLTPIYEFGLTPEGDGAWYVTDFYGDATPVLPRTLRSYITRGGKVDAAALRHTIYSIVQGCLALKRSRGCSHGNLKTTNVFRAGKPRALSKTPLVLGDAFPVAPLQLSQLDPQNKLEVGGLLNATMEVQDLQALGHLIVQLVEVRLLTSEADYDYPITPSPAWDGLGKESERWRQLCNRLLDPSLSLERLNLELLETELRPSYFSTHAPMIAGVAALVCVVLAGGFFGWRYIRSAQAERRQKLYSQDMEQARGALAASDSDPTNILGALRLVEDALRRQPADSDAAHLQTDVTQKRDSLFEKAVREGTNDLAAGKLEDSVAQLQIAATLKPDDAEAKRMRDDARARMAAAIEAAQNEAKFREALKAANDFFAVGDFAKASSEAGVALALKPDDATAKKLQADAGAKLNEQAQAAQRETKFRETLKAANDLFARGDYAKASNEAGAALALKPDDAAARKLQNDANKKLTEQTQAAQNEAKFEETLKAANDLFARGDYAKASSEAGAALALKPDDAAARKLQNDANKKLTEQTQAAQNEAKFQETLKAANDLFARGDYAKASQQAGAALALKPDDAAARKLQADANARLTEQAQAAQRDTKFKEAMNAANDFYTRGDYSRAAQGAIAALALKPGDVAARKLQADAEAKKTEQALAAQKESKFQELMKVANDAFARGDYTKASNEAATALVLKPDDPTARKLQADANAKVNEQASAAQKESKFQDVMKVANDSFARGDFAKASNEAAAALVLKPDDATAKKLQADANAKVNEQALAAQKESKFQDVMKVANDSFARGDYAKASNEAAAALVLKPDDATAKKLQADANAKVNEQALAAQKESKFQDVMKVATDSFARGDFAKASNEAAAALVLKPDDATAKKLQADANAKSNEQAQSTLNDAKFKEAMKAANESFARGDYKAAIKLAGNALDLRQKDPTALKLLDDAQKKLGATSFASASEADYQNAMQEARAAMVRGNYQNALSSAKEALTLKEDDAEAKDLRDQALAKLGKTTKWPQTTNFAGLFGHAIPELDFVWVDGIGAYVAVNELSWDQYRALGGSEGPLETGSKPNAPVSMGFKEAQAFVDSLTARFAAKNVVFRLPRLDEYKTLSGIDDFAAIPKLLELDSSDGERFKRTGDLRPREIVAGLATNKIGLRNVIGNVREWTVDQVAFGNAYYWGQFPAYSPTNAPRPSEQIGLRLMAEPKN